MRVRVFKKGHLPFPYHPWDWYIYLLIYQKKIKHSCRLDIPSSHGWPGPGRDLWRRESFQISLEKVGTRDSNIYKTCEIRCVSKLLAVFGDDFAKRFKLLLPENSDTWEKPWFLRTRLLPAWFPAWKPYCHLLYLLPRKLTCPLKINGWKMYFLLK